MPLTRSRSLHYRCETLAPNAVRLADSRILLVRVGLRRRIGMVCWRNADFDLVQFCG